jgi:hypothetical protein
MRRRPTNRNPLVAPARKIATDCQIRVNAGNCMENMSEMMFPISFGGYEPSGRTSDYTSRS